MFVPTLNETDSSDTKPYDGFNAPPRGFQKVNLCLVTLGASMNRASMCPCEGLCCCSSSRQVQGDSADSPQFGTLQVRAMTVAERRLILGDHCEHQVPDNS